MKFATVILWYVLNLITLVFGLIFGLNVCIAEGHPNPVFRHDLRPFGFPTEAHGKIIGNFSDITFLSDDLLLVSVNTRVYGPVEQLFTDQPLSKLLLFDVRNGSLLQKTEMPLEKASGVVRATHGGEFVVLNEAGLHVCTRELECGLRVATLGPVFVSPEGSKVAVGGNSQTEQKLLDSASLLEIGRFPWRSSNVMPGDGALLIRQNQKLYIRVTGKPDQPVPFGGGGIWPDARFLNRNTIADYESDKSLADARIDGTVLFRMPVTARWHVTDLATAVSGSRFCFHEAGYTTFNSILNFYDIENSRSLDFETANVISAETGKSLFELRWDPRPYVGHLSTPALSPDGHKLAIIRNGFLELFTVQ